MSRVVQKTVSRPCRDELRMRETAFDAFYNNIINLTVIFV